MLTLPPFRHHGEVSQIAMVNARLLILLHSSKPGPKPVGYLGVDRAFVGIEFEYTDGNSAQGQRDPFSRFIFVIKGNFGSAEHDFFEDFLGARFKKVSVWLK